MNRGDAAAATWILRADESRRRRGCDADIPWTRIARRRFHVNETIRVAHFKRFDISEPGVKQKIAAWMKSLK